MSDSSDVIRRAAQRLRQVSDAAGELEAAARRLLEEGYDRHGHRDFLVRRAELFAGLPETLAGELAGGMARLPAEVAAAVNDIAHDASRALTIGSVFYMSVLLYDYERPEGEPDELQKLIARLEGEVEG